MSTTFISIHGKRIAGPSSIPDQADRPDLTPEASILYSSSSVIGILGYTPDEIVNRSAWDFFPEEELSFAKIFHQQRIVMDKAAVLAYCRIQNKAGRWVGCECCFTVVYDIMVVCTSIYHRDGKSDGKFSLDACRPKVCSYTSQAERWRLPSSGACFHLRPKIRDITCSRTSQSSLHNH